MYAKVTNLDITTFYHPEITFINIINGYCHCADPTSKHQNNIKQSIFCGLSNTTNLAFPY